MTDIQYWEDTLSETVRRTQSLIDRVPTTADTVERATLMDEAERLLRGALGNERALKMEISMVRDIHERRHLQNRLMAIDHDIQTLKADLKALQDDENRDELFMQSQAGGGGGDNGSGDVDDPTRIGSKILTDAHRLQDKTQSSLDNTRNLIVQSKEVGVSTLEELNRQRTVIKNIGDETERVDDHLTRATALLKEFGKRMAGSKFIQCFAVVNCLLLIGVVIFAVVKK